MGKEVEIKVLHIDPKAIEEQLIRLGAPKVKHELQTNRLFNAEDYLNQTGHPGYLRLRTVEDKLTGDTLHEFTLKENISEEGARQNIETDVLLEDWASMVYIMEKLGLAVNQVGYKERISYLYNEVLVEIDIWDKETYPNPYLEIEGASIEKIYETLDQMGLSRDQVSTKSILELRHELGLV